MADYTDLIARLRTLHLHDDFSDWDTLAQAAAAIVALTAERDALRDDVKAFLPMWAVEYARRYGLPDSHLHPQHYDRMAEIGCRMDNFTRAALTSPPQKA